MSTAKLRANLQLSPITVYIFLNCISLNVLRPEFPPERGLHPRHKLFSSSICSVRRRRAEQACIVGRVERQMNACKSGATSNACIYTARRSFISVVRQLPRERGRIFFKASKQRVVESRGGRNEIKVND